MILCSRKTCVFSELILFHFNEQDHTKMELFAVSSPIYSYSDLLQSLDTCWADNFTTIFITASHTTLVQNIEYSFLQIPKDLQLEKLCCQNNT